MNHHILTQCDVFDRLATLPDACVDLVVTDPPYASLEEHRKRGTTPRLVDWFPVIPNERFPEIFEQLHRVLKPNTHCYVMCDQKSAFVFKPMGEAAGFKFWKPIVWDKMRMGMGYHYRARYEFILFFEKGKRALNNKGTADVITCRSVRKKYPTEKPPEVARVLIEQSTKPGELVFDPFMGSGSTGEAAALSGRLFLGNDCTPRAFDTAQQRLVDLTTNGLRV